MGLKKFLLVFLLFFYSIPVFGAECGNTVCEPGENSCSCAKDCGLCVAAETETCVAYSCTSDNICKKSTVPLCCGNFVCEKNEDYGNCQRDCSPTKLEMVLVKPTDQSFLRGERVVINAFITAHGRQTLSTIARATGFFGATELLNDGKHFDGNSFDSIYGNAFVVGKETGIGNHKIRIDASFLGAKSYLDFNFNLTAMLDTKLEVFDSYYLGEEIDVRGVVTGKGKPKKMPLDINISFGGNQLVSQGIESSTAGNFSFPYHTSLIDPEGKWLVTISGKDEINNIVFVSKEIEVLKPPRERFLEIELLQDINTIFPAGSFMEVFVRVNERDRDINGARVFLVDERNNSFDFHERTLGVYSISYKIPYSLGTGEKNFAIVAEKTVGEAKIAGNRRFKALIGASGLVVNFLRPTEKTVEAGKSIEIRVFVSYPDETPVQSADVFAVIGENKIRLEPRKEGVFSIAYQTLPDAVSIVQIEVRATDGFGNKGAEKTTIEVLPPGLSGLVQENLPAIAAIIIIAALVLFFTKEKLLSSRGVFSLEARKKHLLKMEQEMQEKYFKHKTVSRSDYKKQMDLFEAELQELESRLKGAGK